MKILGIDHGTSVTGWGLLDATLSDGKTHYTHLDHGLIESKDKLEYPYTIKYMTNRIRNILALNTPDYVALEAPKDNRGFKATQVLTELLGAIKLTCMEARYSFSEISPSTMKKHTTGYGWSTKEEVALAVAKTLGMNFEDLVQTRLYKTGAKAGQLREYILDGTDSLGLALTLLTQINRAGGLDYDRRRD